MSLSALAVLLVLMASPAQPVAALAPGPAPSGSSAASARAPSAPTGPTPPSEVLLGIDVLLEDPSPLVGKRVGVITNATGINREFRSVVDLLHSHPQIELAAIFAPEHGLAGAAQAGKSTESSVDPVTGLPVFSLYGATLRPTARMLRGLDALVFDIQDVGARFYTYTSTMAYALQAAAEHGLEFVVLDRPNPIGGIQVEGPVLQPAFTSFVGVFPLPIRHGMTVGELARYFNGQFGIGARLTVVPMRNWSRSSWYDQTGLKVWVLPSPNMPTLETATVYPGTCLLEGTNLSEGRGTTRPFELVGAPFIDPEAFAAYLNGRGLAGVVFRPASFVPTFSKYQGQRVNGVQLHVTDRERFNAVRTGLEILAAARRLYPGKFSIDRPEHFDRLVGNAWVRAALLSGTPPEQIEARWQKELAAFLQVRQRYLIYR